jgi:hypothetical protein
VSATRAHQTQQGRRRVAPLVVEPLVVLAAALVGLVADDEWLDEEPHPATAPTATIAIAAATHVARRFGGALDDRAIPPPPRRATSPAQYPAAGLRPR